MCEPARQVLPPSPSTASGFPGGSSSGSSRGAALGPGLVPVPPPVLPLQLGPVTFLTVACGSRAAPGLLCGARDRTGSSPRHAGPGY